MGEEKEMKEEGEKAAKNVNNFLHYSPRYFLYLPTLGAAAVLQILNVQFG